MKTSWTKGLDAREKEEMTSSFSSSAFLRARLKALLQEKIDVCRKESVSKDAYDSPNWAFKQADSAGFIRGMQEVMSLIE